jgi:hypothetical protein
MTVMRLALRSPLATLVPLLLLVPVAAITGGCSSGAEVEDGGPTVTATGPQDDATDEPSDEPSDQVQESAPTESTSTPTQVPESVTAVCGPYVEMARAIKSAGFGGADPDELAAAIAPVMKEFAAQVPTLERPPGVSAATWRGVEALAERILALPDHPTYADVEAVEDELSEQEWDAVRAARDWLSDNCHL